MKTKTWITLFLAGLMALSVAGLTACNETSDTPGPDTPTPPGPDLPDPPGPIEDAWHNQSIWLSEEPLVPEKPVTMPVDDAGRNTNVAVHDPSVFQDPKDGKYYVFGSHFAVASSFDLIYWEQEARDNQDDKLFAGGVRAAMPETLKLANNNSDAWAPDVEYYNGKYYMYISFTTAMYTNTSVIARVEADSVMGPYSNEKILLESISKDAQASGSDKPNCIDPELFYDKDGRLWMVYGSFFGGIYIKELYNEGENWGLPKEEGLNNWGKRIWLNGYSNGVEGPFVFYNASTDYYYLMTSEDDLMTKYNMRIARSKSPDGPYVDSTGKDVATDGKGNKLAGNYKFESQYNGIGYAALGHNSVIKDKDGRYFVIYHARRQSGSSGNAVTAAHNLYVSQLFFNEDGWPVMSPNAFVGEERGTVEESAVAGDYSILLHSVANDQNFVGSVSYTLASDGKVMQGTAEKGSWTLKESYYIEITLDGVVYKGVVVPGWDMYSSESRGPAVLSVTAVSDQGRALWAIAK